jgi:heme/copper-type cytochrome/quinol oxidase subunit 4
MLYAVLALISAVLALVFFFQWTSSDDNRLFLVIFIIFILATLGFGGLFLSGRVNKTEDIHITE